MLIPEHVLKGAPWSMSKVGCIEKCNLQFNYKYHPDPKQRLKEIDVREESRVGVAVHKALELALDGLPTRKAFLHAADTEELPVNELEQLESFFDQVERFRARMWAFRQKAKVTSHNVFIERKWAVKSDFTPARFFDNDTAFFRGVVDYALLTPSQDLIIIDHKSGREREIGYYDRQFKAYAIMAVAQYPKLKNIQTGINFINTDALVWNKPVTLEQVRDEYIPWLINDMTEACQKLLEPVQPTRGKHCDWCGYKSLCQGQAA